MQYIPALENKELTFEAFVEQIMPAVRKTSKLLTMDEIYARMQDNISFKDFSIDYTIIQEGLNISTIKYKGKIVGEISYQASPQYGGLFEIRGLKFKDISNNEINIDDLLTSKGASLIFSRPEYIYGGISMDEKTIKIRAIRSFKDILSLFHEIGHIGEEVNESVKKFFISRFLNSPAFEFDLESDAIDNYDKFELSMWNKFKEKYNLTRDRDMLGEIFSEEDLENLMKDELKAWYNSYKYLLGVLALFKIPFESYQNAIIHMITLTLSTYYKTFQEHSAGESLRDSLRKSFRKGIDKQLDKALEVINN